MNSDLKFNLPILNNHGYIPDFKNNGENKELYKALEKQASKIGEELKELKTALNDKNNYEVLYESLDLLQSTLSIIDILYANCEVFEYILLEHKRKLELRNWKYIGKYNISLEYGE